MHTLIVNLFQGHTPLHLAARHGHERITSFLLEKGAKPNTKNKLVYVLILYNTFLIFYF